MLLVAILLLPACVLGDKDVDFVENSVQKDRTTIISVSKSERERVIKMIDEASPNMPVMRSIAAAESNFDCGVRNPSSTAKGGFQILKSTWEGEQCTGDILNAEDNISCARKLYDRYGLSPWNASKDIWSKRN